MILKAEKNRWKRFRTMGLTFIVLAIFFGGGAYFFPTEPFNTSYEWLYLTHEEKESFYMISLVFLAAGGYCLFRNQI